MKLGDQVVSLELSKKLRELGVKQESLFYWQYSMTLPPNKNGEFQNWYVNYGDTSVSNDALPAYTVAELGAMLPFTIGATATGQEKEDIWYLGCHKAKEWWNVEYSNIYSDLFHQTSADTEADARAKMLIYLLEQGLVKL